MPIMRPTLENLTAFLIERGQDEVIRVHRNELAETHRRVTLDVKWRGDWLEATTLDNEDEDGTIPFEEPEAVG